MGGMHRGGAGRGLGGVFAVLLGLAACAVPEARGQNCEGTPTGGQSRCQTPVIAGSLDPYSGINGPRPELQIDATQLRLNLAMWMGFGPANLPPRSVEIGSSSLPLVSADMLHGTPRTGHPARPTLNGLIDLVTGFPLHQEVDFELPFGGAVFRRIRTFSDSPSARFHPGTLWNQREHAASHWDWNGQNWMMSENPILLIDAAYHEVVGGTPTGDPRYCYLILDAHHAIPFERDANPDTPHTYHAPNWFDAKLISGDPDSNQPETFTVLLHGGALEYTFAPQYEDMPIVRVELAEGDPRCLANTWYEGKCDCLAHEAPPVGWGLPYYAFLTSIKDRYGNRVEISHVAQRQFAAGPTGTYDWCAQNCNEKGQVSHVKLYPPGENTPAAWTLIYTHRAFSATDVDMVFGDNIRQCPDGVDELGTETRLAPGMWQHWYPHALHSVHVYEGDLDTTSMGSPTLPLERFYGEVHYYPGGAPFGFVPNTAQVQSFDEYDRVDAAEMRGLPANWQVCVQYTYDEFHHEWHRDARAGSQYANAWIARTAGLGARNQGGSSYGTINLLKATVRRQDAAGTTEGPRATETMYRYDWAGENQPNDHDRQTAGTGLRGVYTAESSAWMLGREWESETPSVEGPFLPTSINELFLIPAQANTSWTDDAGVLHSRCMAEAASYYCRNEEWESGYNPDLMADLGMSLDDAVGDDLGRRYLLDSRGEERLYRLWYFRQYTPDNSNISVGPVEATSVDTQSIFQFPYQQISPPTAWWTDGTAGLHPIDLDYPAHTAVIDELEWTPERAMSGTRPQLLKPETLGSILIKSRRVVEMNARGLVLSDRTYECTDPECSAFLDHIRFGEHRYYDEHGRVIALGTRGYTSSENQSPEDTGLIRFFEYPDPFEDEYGREIVPREFTALGVQSGWDPENPQGSQKYYTHVFERPDQDRLDLVTVEKRFRVPTTDPTSADPASVEITTTDFWLDEDHNKAVRGKLVTRPQSNQPAPNGTVAASYPFERWQYDDRGNNTWHAIGQFAADQNGGPTSDVLSAFVTSRSYESGTGRLTTEVVDTAVSGGDTADPLGGQFVRLQTDPALSTPLNLLTTYEYKDPWGVSKIIHPDETETHIVWQYDPSHNDAMYQTIYKGVRLGGSDDSLIELPIERSHIVSGQLVEKVTVRPTTETMSVYPPALPIPTPESAIISRSEPEYDSSGKVVGMSTTGGVNGPSLTAHIGYAAGGGIDYQQDPDGTITRNEYDQYGRLWKTYRGTEDYHTYWDTAPPPEDCDDPASWNGYDDNLALVEVRSYGEGVTDNNQLTQIRSLRDKPVNQYNQENCDTGEPIGGENNESELGSFTNYEYDWRMRQVLTRRTNDPVEPTGPPAPLTHSLTWYDHLDRVRFTAEYGPTVPAGGTVDPRAALPGAVEPSAAEILAATPAPLSLSETVYNHRGLAEEVRRYDVSDASGATFTATRTYYDHADRPVHVRAPNSADQQTVYDAKNRAVVTRTVVGTVGAGTPFLEITKTENAFDDKDRVIASAHYERAHDAEATAYVLDATNSIITYSFSWYDDAGRVVATANYGTNAEGDTFTNATTPPNRTTVVSPATFDADGMVDGCIPSAAISGGLEPLCTCYSYDSAGRQVAVFHPDGTVTRSEYDGLGRLLLTVENADAAAAADRRVTAHKYDDQGRLTHMAAVLPQHAGGVTLHNQVNWSASDGSLQVTRFTYGAPVVDSGGAAISAHNAWIAQVFYPGAHAASLSFTYYSDGSVASRTDARGVQFSYRYDELGRLVETLVDDDSCFAGAYAALAPATRIARIVYAYTQDGLPATVTAHDPDDNVLTENAFDYDGLRNLLHEWQAHAGAVGSGTPFIGYDWETSSADEGNYNRLDAMTYPTLSSQAGRVISLDYGAAAGDSDDRMSRVTKVSASGVSGSLGQYAYAGSSRRVSATIGAALLALDFFTGSAAGYPGLDRFGRVIDQHYVRASGAGAGQSVHRYQYGYDLSGNRTFARVTQVPVDSVPQDNTRSYAYGYDDLQRLRAADLGALDSGNQNVPSPTRAVDWWLDNLGNWSGAPDPDGDPLVGDSAPSVTIVEQPVGGGAAVTTTLHHQTAIDNALQGILRDDGTGGSAAAPLAILSDSAGNLVFETARAGTGSASYFYQYDAWCRLISVYDAGTIVPAEVNAANGQVNPNAEGELGPWLVRFAYDGLGRLAWKETPVVIGDSEIRREAYYYDGVRRVKEHVTRFEESSTLVAMGGGGGDPNDPNSGGDPNNPGEPEAPTEEQLAQSAGIEQPAEVVPLDPIAPLALISAPAANWEQREYVWSPAADGYVDELLCQIAPTGAQQPGAPPGGRVLYALLDANCNVMGLVRAWTGGGFASGAVVEQYVYAPYGEVLAVDILDPNTSESVRNAVGHQGLFFVRFDGLNTDPTLAADAQGAYYNRARWYGAKAGRFSSKDSNESALVILVALAHNGRTVGLVYGAFDAVGHFQDGMNLYSYVGANPINRLDPTGRLDFTMGGLLVTAGAQGLIGGLVGGTISSVLGNGSFGSGFASGAVGGFFGGGAAYAFAASASGLFATLAVSGGVDGFVSGYAGSVYENGLDWKANLADAMFSAVVGAATGGALDYLGSLRWKIVPYKEAQKLTRGHKGDIQGHHILEVRHIERWGGIDAATAPAVILTRDEHGAITNALRQRLPYGRTYSRADVWSAYNEVYAAYPHWLAAIRKYFE